MECIGVQNGKCRKMRSPDFSTEEISIIITYHLQHSNILSSKHSNEMMQRQKKEIYEKLVNDVNNISSHYRSLQSIKDKWQNIQRDWRSRSNPLVLPFSIDALQSRTIGEGEVPTTTNESIAEASATAGVVDGGCRTVEWKSESPEETWSGLAVDTEPSSAGITIKTETETHEELPQFADADCADLVPPEVAAFVPPEVDAAAAAATDPAPVLGLARSRRRPHPLGVANYRRLKLALLRRRTKAAEALAASQRGYYEAKRVYVELLTARLRRGDGDDQR